MSDNSAGPLEVRSSAGLGALPDFDDPRVQKVYLVLCSEDDPPDGQHWEGFTARRIVAALDAPDAASLTRWVMHDNHTFTRLPADSDAAYALAMKCFDDDRGWIMLCGTWSDERTSPERRRPEYLMAHAVETRAAFAEQALRWLRENPGA